MVFLLSLGQSKLDADITFNKLLLLVMNTGMPTQGSAKVPL